MGPFVEVAINLPQISSYYHYHLPSELVGSVVPGSLVIVPFGNQRVQGVVLRFIQAPDVAETRPVEDLVEEKPALTPAQIELAHWLAEETLSSLGDCLHLMLPPGLSQRTDSLIQLNPKAVIDESALSPLEKQIIHLVQARGELRGRQIDAKIKHVEWRGSLRKLVREGFLQTKAILPPPRVQSKTVRKVSLAVDSGLIENTQESLSRVQRVHERRLRVLQLLARDPDLVEPSWVYSQTGANYSDLQALHQAGLIQFYEVQVWRDPLEDATYLPTRSPELTREQARAWKIIQAGMHAAWEGRAPSPLLLHGVTGSGKTELYLRAGERTLAQGKQAIILVPEISLTPQTIKRFLARFPGKVGVIHSKLSEGERYDTWRRVRLGKLPVLIGPRSALFMPQEDLGLIVVDECHDESYDQQDRSPYYRGVHTAIAYARLSGAAVILGSATPRVTQFYPAVSGGWTLIELPKRILAHRETVTNYQRRLGMDFVIKPGEGQTADLGLPEVTVIDMREELKAGNRRIFSRALYQGIQDVLKDHQQAILFLNRRGTATYVFCRDCGQVIKCPHDDKPLTYHHPQRELICHTCGYTRKLPKTCPNCGGHNIRQLGTGTEKVEQQVQELFPGVRTIRWDAETTRSKGAHDRILTYFSNQQADVLIGTQMLAKGLDLPLVTLVGVILAEVGLNLPDYRASERTFQVLTQVAGRAGRSPLGGKVILQTYDPSNYAIQAAAHHDFHRFYEQEMAYRRELRYPPFAELVRMEYQHHDARIAEETAQMMGENLREWIRHGDSRVDLIGPAPCFFSRMYGRYRWQIVLRGPNPKDLLRNRQFPDWIIEVDPSSLL